MMHQVMHRVATTATGLRSLFQSTCQRALASRAGGRFSGRFKLVATDLDGTFMRDDGLPPWLQTPSARNITAVEELIDRNIYFVLISGRMISNMAPLLHAMGDRIARNKSTFIAGYNGGVIVGPPTSAIDTMGASRTPVAQTVLPNYVIDSAVEYTKREGLLMKVYFRDDGKCALTSCGDFDYSKEQANFFFGCGEYPYQVDHKISTALLTAEKLAEQAKCPFPISRIARDAELIKALRPHKIVVLTDDPDTHMSGADKALGGKGAQHLVRGNFWYEYMPSGVNKSTALAHLASMLNIRLDECVSFGDSSNDFEMLRDSGLGIAMANARDDVKRVAGYTSQYTNEEDGVGRELEYLIEHGAFHQPPA